MMNMPRFFVNKPIVDFFEISGDDAYHIMKSLRMKVGDTVILCCDNTDYMCKIMEFKNCSVNVELLSKKKCVAEPNVKLTLFQGIPKGEKMDLIIQKTVEIGVCNIVPVLTSRCVSRPDEKSLKKKVLRWQKIALEAAKQSGRGMVPQVLNTMNFNDAVNFANINDKVIVFYEGGGVPLYHIVNNEINSTAVFIGPEGGFESYEVQQLIKSGAEVSTLGPRILRTETAAMIATSLIIYEHERS